MPKSMKTVCVSVTLVLLSYNGFSQDTQIPVSESEKSVIIKKTISLLKENYIFPQKVTEVRESLISKLNDGSYKSATNLEQFLNEVNTDLERTTEDKHVNISFGPARVKQIIKEKQNDNKTVPLTKEWLEKLNYENFRLRKVEWLDGNIGYFRFLNFTDLQVAKESIVGAMNFIRHSNAIILDLRDNGGGSSETLSFVLSYFLKSSLKVGEFHYRKNNRVEEIRIPNDPVVKKVPDNVPVYILVSKRTASAAEGLVSNLQAFKRATIIGENTKGEGNPGELFVINEQLYVLIPTAISVSAVPGRKSVQGVGATPDIAIAPDKALDKALLEICKKLSQTAPNDELKKLYQWQIPVWENNLSPQTAPESFKSRISGNYMDERQLTYENNDYYYISKDKQKIKLSYYGNNIFGMEGKQFTRLRIPEMENLITYFEFIWDDGFIKKILRDN
ncbi:MAG: S41 family peptidase [Sphingobacteriales bacterium]|nr:S41 family peptidase [Sphingobacteriales bacterium]